MEPCFVEWIVYEPLEGLAVPFRDLYPKVFSPSPRRDILSWEWHERSRMFVAEDWFGRLSIAGGAVTFLNSIIVDREPWRVDP